MIENFRYTGINLSVLIQGVVMKEKIYFLCPQKHCFKDTNKPVHWVGHSKLRSLDKDYFFKRTPQFDENQASVTRKK